MNHLMRRQLAAIYDNEMMTTDPVRKMNEA
jgi:hypothetical protein